MLYLQKDMERRQLEINRIVEILAKHTTRKGHRAGASKVTTIVLGAFVATQAVAAKIFGDASVGVTVVYAIAGLLIAAVGGLEAAFKIESRSAALRALAAQCQSQCWQIDSDWLKSVVTVDGEEKVVAARPLLEKQNKCISDTHTKAAELGVDITFEVRSLYGQKTQALA